MSDDTTLPTGDAETGDADPKARVSRRALLFWGAIALALVVVFASVGSWVVRALTSLGEALPDVVGVLIEGVPERASDDAHWVGSGRFAVVQSFDSDAVPYIVVWDRQTGALREEAGVALAAVEPHAPVVWLRRVSEGSDSPAPGQDAATEQLLVWQLDDPAAAPTADVDSRWRPWAGTGGYAARLEVDASRGAYPARLSFATIEPPGEFVLVGLPDDLMTFMPLGWSQSGRFFAVQEMMRAGEGPVGGRRVIIVSAQDGSITAQADLPRDVIGKVVWDNRRDALLWTAPRSTGDPARPPRWTVMELTASGEERIVGLRVPERWSRAWSVRFVGTSVSGPVVVVDTDDSSEVWQLAAEGPAQRGSVPFGATEWVDGAGLLVVSYRWHEPTGGSILEVATYDLSGESRREVYEASLPEVEVQEER